MRPVAFVFLIGACTAPIYPNYGAPSKTVTVDGLTFRVHYTATQAEAHRLTPMSRPDFNRIWPAGLRAIEQASGCAVNRGRAQGDPAKIAAQLVC